MEVEEDNKRPAEEAAITTNNIIYSPNLAPIAQPEIHEELNEVVEPEIQQELPSSSSVQYSESIILPIGGNEKKQKFGMLRLRRKRRQDPFGNLILSTKKMKLNDLGEPINGQAQAPNGIKQNASASNMQQNGSLECGDDDELVFYYGGEDDEDDSADGYDDDEDSNAEQYYKNDYPEEEVVNEFENESTSEDDYFDHYGDESVKYRNYCYDKDNDKNVSSDEDDID